MAERNYAPVHEVTMYQARCTHCGRVETDYGDYTAMGDPHAPIEQVTEFWGWWEVVEWTPDPNRAEVPNARVGETVELLCPNCQECEVCGARAYPLDSHLVCEDHEDTFTNTANLTTGASMMLIADLTHSPRRRSSSTSRAGGQPSSLASSWTRIVCLGGGSNLMDVPDFRRGDTFAGPHRCNGVGQHYFLLGPPNLSIPVRPT